MRPLKCSRAKPGPAFDLRITQVMQGFSMSASRGAQSSLRKLSLVDRHHPPAEPPGAVLLDRGEFVTPGQVGSGRAAVFHGENLDIAASGRFVCALAGKPE